MTHKIAIITTSEFEEYFNDYDRINKVIDSITDWQEVSDADFKTLQYAACRLNFTIIEQPVDPKEFIAKTIADYIAISKADAKREAEEEQKKEAAALERKYKKELKDKDSKIKMLKKLQEELGVGLDGLPGAVL